MAELVNGFLYPTKAISIDASAPDPATGYNIAPTQQVSLLYPEADGQLIASSARWWFVPPWHKGDVKDWKATTFNAKIETAFEKPTFRQSWNSGRCLILASGYYEWSGPKTDKQPHRIYVEQNQPIMLFAGLQSKRRDGMRSCTILTRAALPEIQELHPRMPVVLNSDEAERWLSGADSNDTIQAEYGTQWQGRFRHHRVAKFGARDDGPELIEEFNDRLF